MSKLPTIKINGTAFYIDRRLSQIRQVNNPHKYEPVSQEIIDYWISRGIVEL